MSMISNKSIEEISNSNKSVMDASIIEQVVMQGDLSKLNPEQRVTYYHNVCKSLGLNPMTRPFDYISLNGKLTLYAKKDATEQLRKVNGISITSVESKVVDDLYIVTVMAQDKTGRTDAATGAVSIANLKGDNKANAIMKAETKAKRRVTLSIAGMGWVDETEIETIPSAKPVTIDISTGVIEDKKVEQPPNPPIPLPTITEEQVQYLMNLCNEVQPWFYDDVLMPRLEKNKLDSISDIPVPMFKNVEAFIKRSIEEKNKT